MTPHKSYGNWVPVKFAEFLICDRVYHADQLSQWPQSSKMDSLTGTEL